MTTIPHHQRDADGRTIARLSIREADAISAHVSECNFIEV